METDSTSECWIDCYHISYAKEILPARSVRKIAVSVRATHSPLQVNVQAALALSLPIVPLK